ncbi:MAG: DUF3800 domain-containing protein [Dermatophilaceae bacterium]
MNSPIPSRGVRLFYIDDSGTVDTGHIVYSWIEVTPDCWNGGLRHWIDLRKELYATHKIPPATELHAAQFVGGRGRPSTDSAVNASKAARREVMTRALKAIGENPDIVLGTVYRKTTTTGPAYARQRVAVYEKLLQHLDARLVKADEFGMIFMDGSDQAYQRAHRQLKLSSRRIIEDPVYQSSHISQWVQMADLVAWSTYQSLLRHPRKRFTWNWYQTHLYGRDTNGGPVEV